jgi:hypothetical protein
MSKMLKILTPPKVEHLPKVGILEGGIRLFLDRGKPHGGECAAKAQRLKAVMAGGRNWDRLRDGQRQALEMIACKFQS